MTIKNRAFFVSHVVWAPGSAGEESMGAGKGEEYGRPEKRRLRKFGGLWNRVYCRMGWGKMDHFDYKLIIKKI